MMTVVQVEMVMEVNMVMKVIMVVMEMVVALEVEGRPRWLIKIWPTPNIIMNNHCYASSSFEQSSSCHHHRDS